MNVLVIGSGGREHAVIKALAQSENVKKIFCAPGNAGIAESAALINLDIRNHSQVIEFCRQNRIDLVVVGPEDPLVDGLTDSLRAHDIAAFGPSKEAARLEGSKIFAKEFMQNAGVPTAKALKVSSVEETLLAAKNFTPPYVLKADGLAAGKGVFICSGLQELKESAEKLFDKKIFGEAGMHALLEQNIPGKEISFLILTNGSEYQVLPLAQDHKRLLDGNKGPNTGGMGTIAPMELETGLYNRIITEVVKPSVEELKKRNYLFRGVLFIGLMISENRPYVLEYNVRFGDPETQVILPLIENDLAQLFFKLSQGELEKIRIRKKTVFCIVNAAPGYPDDPRKNIPLVLPENTNDSYILHASTKLNSENRLTSSGGRVLNIVAIRDSFEQARKAAYETNAHVVFEGRQFRSDLGLYK